MCEATTIVATAFAAAGAVIVVGIVTGIIRLSVLDEEN